MDAAEAWDSAVPVGSKPQSDAQSAWDAAAPVKLPKAAPAVNATKVPERPGTAIMEGVANMGTSMIAKPVSDVAGLAATAKEMISPTPGGGDPASFKRSVQEGMTYEPKTHGGAALAEYNPMALIGKLLGWTGEKAGQIAAPPGKSGPVRSAIGSGIEEAVPQVASILGAKAAGSIPKPPVLEPGVKTLLDRGVPLTPGEIKGGGYKRVEEALESIPGAGAPIKAARGRGVEAFNAAAVNDSLAPIGKVLPKGLKGNDAIAWARGELGDAYEVLLPKMKGALDNAPPANALPAPGQVGAPPKPTFRQELENLRQMGNAGLGDAQKAGLNRIIDKEVIEKFSSGKADGQTLKNIQSRLTDLSKGMRKSEDYQVRDLGLAVDEVQAAMRRMIEDVNPKHQAELAKINEGYAKFKIAQQAAAAPGAKEGTFTGAQYDRAVRNKDSSKDKRAYSEGTANQQDLSQAAKSTLSPVLPDSGTPFRAATMKMLMDPKAMGLAAAGTIPAWLLYSPMGIRMMQQLLTKPPNVGATMGPMMMGAGQLGAGQLPQPPAQ